MNQTFNLKIDLIRKVLMLSLLLGGITFCDLHAQDEVDSNSILDTSQQPDYRIGAHASLNINSFSQPGNVIGTSLGGFFRYQLLDFLQLEGGLQYSLKGGARHELYRSFDELTAVDNYNVGQIDGPLSGVSYLNRSVYINSIDIPVKARLTLPELANASISPKFIVGFAYGYNFAVFEQHDALYSFDNGTQFLLSNRSENVSSDYFKHNLSIILGMAVDYTLTNGQVFTTEITYQKGFTNLNDIKLGSPYTTDALKSQVTSIQFSYSIF